MKKARAGFTMIELIFVIVIIGILAAVAIPKLAANRDDATAATCVHEIGQLISEVLAQYTKLGYTAFSATEIGDMTNILTGATGNKSGITSDSATKVSDAVYYSCEGGLMFRLTGAVSGQDYNLTLETNLGITSPPAAVIAVEYLTDNLNLDRQGTGIKILKL